MPMPTDPAALAAAEAAARKSTIEIWTLFSVAVGVTVLRTYARLSAAGSNLRNLRADDYLVWVGVILYAAQSALGYSVGNAARGLANNSMTDAEREMLRLDDPEYHFRVVGSKVQIAGWTVYAALITALKLSVLSFYLRLTEGLGRRYRIQIRVGFLVVLASFIAAVIAIFASCRPLHKYWQIHPDPGNACHAAVSFPIVWTHLAANVLTDIYLIFIPLPMLWRSTLRTIKKVASSIVLGAGVFVLVCAVLKSVFVLVDPDNGAHLAGTWGIREAFVAIITTNLPMIFPLIRTLLAPVFGAALGLYDRKTGSRATPYRYYDGGASPRVKTPASKGGGVGVRTIGGSGYSRSRAGRGWSGNYWDPDQDHGSDSENASVMSTSMRGGSQDRIVGEEGTGDVRMEELGKGGIMVSREVEVKVVDGDGERDRNKRSRYGNGAEHAGGW